MQKSINNLVSHIYAFGVRHVILCPGNRSAPITLSFIRHKGFKCFSLVDERSAAHTALGIASATCKPVVIVCTSGTAVLNFYPAIAEAYYSQIPLIVITADRPFNVIDNWEGQCIRQNNIFEKHIIASFTFDYKFTENFDFKKTLKLSVFPVKGPIHINIPLDEPLFADNSEFFYPDIKLLNDEEPEFINNLPILELYSKILIIAGADVFGARLTKECKFLAKNKNIVFLADILSGLHSKQNINNWDLICKLSSEEVKQKLKPDILITFGKIIVSKSLSQFLKKYKPLKHWHITPNNTIADPFQTLPEEIKCNEADFLKWLHKNITKTDKSYFYQWKYVSNYFDKKVNQLFVKTNFNDMAVTRFVLNNLKENCNIFLANSMPIRYVSFMPDMKNNFKIYGNRGVSGIDGTTSSAAGISMVSKSKTILLTGDLSFFYDINGMWNKYLKANFKIIVLNNNGGGIFRLIDGPDKIKESENFFSVSSNRNCKAIADSFGFGYYEANDFESLNKNFDNFMKFRKSSAIFEIKIKPNNTVDFFKKLNNIK